MLTVLVVLRKCWYFPNWRGTQLTFQSFRFNFVRGQNTQTIRRICMGRPVQKPTFQDVPWSKVMAGVWKSPLCQILPGLELCIITCCRQEAVIALLIIITTIMIKKSSSPQKWSKNHHHHYHVALLCLRYECCTENLSQEPPIAHHVCFCPIFFSLGFLEVLMP